MNRIALTGGPRAGKSTYAATLRGTHDIMHSDDLIGHMDWSELSAEVATWLDKPGPYVIEGCAVIRSLRKWLAANPTGKPCDLLIWMAVAKVELTSKQVALLKGCTTVFIEVRPELLRRGVKMEFR